LVNRANIGDTVYYVSTIVTWDEPKVKIDEDGTKWVESKVNQYYRIPVFEQYTVTATMFVDYSSAWPQDNRYRDDEYCCAFVKNFNDDSHQDIGNIRIFDRDNLYLTHDEAIAALDEKMQWPV